MFETELQTVLNLLAVLRCSSGTKMKRRAWLLRTWFWYSNFVSLDSLEWLCGHWEIFVHYFRAYI